MRLETSRLIIRSFEPSDAEGMLQVFGDPDVRKFFERSNPWALRAIAERLLEAHERGLWRATAGALDTLRSALLEAEGWEEAR